MRVNYKAKILFLYILHSILSPDTYISNLTLGFLEIKLSSLGSLIELTGLPEFFDLRAGILFIPFHVLHILQIMNMALIKLQTVNFIIYIHCTSSRNFLISVKLSTYSL